MKGNTASPFNRQNFNRQNVDQTKASAPSPIQTPVNTLQPNELERKAGASQFQEVSEELEVLLKKTDRLNNTVGNANAEVTALFIQINDLMEQLSKATFNQTNGETQKKIEFVEGKVKVLSQQVEQLKSTNNPLQYTALEKEIEDCLLKIESLECHTLKSKLEQTVFAIQSKSQPRVLQKHLKDIILECQQLNSNSIASIEKKTINSRGRTQADLQNGHSTNRG